MASQMLLQKQNGLSVLLVAQRNTFVMQFDYSCVATTVLLDFSVAFFSYFHIQIISTKTSAFMSPLIFKFFI